MNDILFTGMMVNAIKGLEIAAAIIDHTRFCDEPLDKETEMEILSINEEVKKARQRCKDLIDKV